MADSSIIAGTGRTYLLTVTSSEQELTLCNTISTILIRVLSGEDTQVWFPTDTEGNYWTMKVTDLPLGPIGINAGSSIKFKTSVLPSTVQIIGWG